MSYKHILVAVDLTPESKILIEKSVSLARPLNAVVSFIHVEANYEELCRHNGIMDADLHDNCEVAAKRAFAECQKLSEETDYPIKHCLVGTGEYSQELKQAIEKHEVDLIVLGHHHDLWGTIISSTKSIINNINVDMLVIPMNK